MQQISSLLLFSKPPGGEQLATHSSKPHGDLIDEGGGRYNPTSTWRRCRKTNGKNHTVKHSASQGRQPFIRGHSLAHAEVQVDL